MCIKRKNLIGNRYGHLIVEEMLYGYKGKRTYCRCKCDCGNDHIIMADHLQNRRNPSCGCMVDYYKSINNRTNEIGKIYGQLKIVDIDYSNKPSIAICECSCGSIIRVNKADVVSGHTQSCGCFQAQQASKFNTKDFTGFKSESGVVICKPLYQNEHGVWMWECICPLCKQPFVALPAKIISNHTTSCGCKIQSSKERIIESILIEFGVNFERQKRFDDCRYKYSLPFDFVIYNDDNTIKCLIEYDGEQHFRSVDFYGGEDSYQETKVRDQIKDDYCKCNNILLIRLNYTQTIEEIKTILTNTIYP